MAFQYQPIISTIGLVLDSGVEISSIDDDFVTTGKRTTTTANYLNDSANFTSALLQAGGLMHYVLDVVDTTDAFSEIFGELYAFLGEPLFQNFNSSLWKDVAKLMSGMVQVLTRNDYSASKRDHYEDFGFQYNGD